ncbi:PTS sugar transporter subunit IIA [Furfurilactobacillus sp. WILCCON 0119]
MVLLEKELILLDVDATDDVNALTQIAEQLHKQGVVKETYRDAIIKREQDFSTGLQTATVGVAIPHTDAEHVNTAKIAFARLTHPVTFKQMGDGSDVPVQLIFMLALTEPHAQLTMLQNLMTMFQEATVMDSLLHAKDQESVLALLQQHNII